MAETEQPAESIHEGTVMNDRFEIRQSLGKGGMGEVFLAYDRSTQQTVSLKVVRAESRMPGDDEALRQELLLARSVGHPNVCRVHDLAPSPWGPVMVMELIPGETLHTHIRRRKAKGTGYTADEFRKVASDCAAGLAAIHAQGLVHGDLKPGNVMVTSDRAVILDFGFAQERARLSKRKAGAPPDGGTPNYMSPERLRSGGASAEDDIYALGLTLWEMWTCKVPEPGAHPRAKPMRTQIMFDVPSGLSTDEVKQIFRCLGDRPDERPKARHLRFFNPTVQTTTQMQIPRDRLNPGPPTGRASVEGFQPGSQSLLVTYATNAPEAVGRLYPLSSPVLSIGRRPDQNLCLDEPTVSGHHAQVTWKAGSWVVEDAGSTNGTYADHTFTRMKSVTLMHGGEVQVGECRLKLVSFSEGSPSHERAKAYLEKRDGLTGLLLADQFIQSLQDECDFSGWDAVALHVAIYELKSAGRPAGERLTITEMLALRHAAQRVVELTETLLLSVVPLTAGRDSPLRFAVAMSGPSFDEASSVVEQVVSQTQSLLPESMTLAWKFERAQEGQRAADLIRAD